MRALHDRGDNGAPCAPDRSRSSMQLLAAQRGTRARWKGLILTGSEITLHRDLAAMGAASRAAMVSSTFASRLTGCASRPQHCEPAGRRQAWTNSSSAWPPQTRKTHDAITQVPKDPSTRRCAGWSCSKSSESVTSITNTGGHRATAFRHLPALVERLKRAAAAGADGILVLLSDERDRTTRPGRLPTWRGTAVPAARPSRLRATDSGRGIEVKNFPECLLGNDCGRLQPPAELFIDPAF